MKNKNPLYTNIVTVALHLCLIKVCDVRRVSIQTLTLGLVALP